MRVLHRVEQPIEHNRDGTELADHDTEPRGHIDHRSCRASNHTDHQSHRTIAHGHHRLAELSAGIADTPPQRTQPGPGRPRLKHAEDSHSRRVSSCTTAIPSATRQHSGRCQESRRATPPTRLRLEQQRPARRPGPRRLSGGGDAGRPAVRTAQPPSDRRTGRPPEQHRVHHGADSHSGRCGERRSAAPRAPDMRSHIRRLSSTARAPAICRTRRRAGDFECGRPLYRGPCPRTGYRLGEGGGRIRLREGDAGRAQPLNCER